METHKKEIHFRKTDCCYHGDPQERNSALGEMCPLSEASVNCSTLSANIRNTKQKIGEPKFQTRLFSNAGRTGHPCSSGQSDSVNVTLEPSWVNGGYVIGDSGDLKIILLGGDLGHNLLSLEDLGKFQAKLTLGFSLVSAASRKGYRIYNKRTRRLMETIHVTFDEMHQTMAPVRMSSGPEPFVMTPGQLKSGLAPTDKELEMLFQPMFDEYLEQSRVNEPVPSATEVNAQVVPPGTSLSTTIAQDAPSTSALSSTSDMHHPVRHQGIAEEPTHEDSPINHDVLHPPLNPVTREPSSAQSSSGNVNSAEPNQVNQPPDHLRRWTKDHPLDNIVGNPSHPVSTRKQLASDALWCCFHTELSKVEPKNFKMAVIEDCWFQAMQDEIHEFDHLEVWELVPRPIYVMVIALKWIYKV
ncbi:putative ribonuclease H-like domain-containing protein, partial [Tanacetum coccineum]